MGGAIVGTAAHAQSKIRVCTAAANDGTEVVHKAQHSQSENRVGVAADAVDREFGLRGNTVFLWV